VPIENHPLIRSAEGCYQSTKRAIAIAEKYKARLHILHLTTETETHLFRNDIPLSEKNITTEVSVQNLWFSDKDYKRLGTLIKWNPAIKSEKDRLLKALLDDRIDIITTDHAHHRRKAETLFFNLCRGPMVQHSCILCWNYIKEGLSL
jgi:dihydroorotase